MMGDESDTPVDPEDLRKHLDLIQGVVNRMSAASSNAKRWLLPVVTAAYGFALVGRSGSVSSIGLVAVLLFAYIDANYLNQERKYRQLYNAVALGQPNVPRFSLDPADVCKQAESSITPPTSVSVMRQWLPDRRVWQSWSIAPFYGALLVVGIVILVLALVR